MRKFEDCKLFNILILSLFISFWSCTKDELTVDNALDSSGEQQPSAPGDEEDLPGANENNVDDDFTADRIHFDFDRFFIKSEFEPTLQKIAEYLQRNNNDITIEGHCDDRGTTNYNIFLGNKRAESAKAYLVKMGVAANRIKVVSFGEEYPLSKEKNARAHSLNRRAEFILR